MYIYVYVYIYMYIYYIYTYMLYIYLYIYVHGAGSLQMVAVSIGHGHTIEQLGTCLGMVSAAVVIAMDVGRCSSGLAMWTGLGSSGLVM